MSTESPALHIDRSQTGRERAVDAAAAGGESLPPLGRLTIFSKVLLANVAIVVLGAVVGTWTTIVVVRRATDERFFPLAVIFAFAGIVLSLAVNYVALRAAFRPLARLQEAALAVRRGDLTARADEAAFTDPEVRNLAETLNGTLDEIARDRVELNHLASQVIRAQEDERRRIARELHDDTAQVLFAQLIRLSALKGSDDIALHDLAESLEQMTSEALESVRRLALELRPPALDDLGLLAALAELAQRYSDQLHIPVDYLARGTRGRLDSDAELVLYRIAQEALTNIAKHAHASSAWIDLDRTGEDVMLSIRDNGVGFSTTGAVRGDDRGLGLGLFGMEERAALMGGRLRIWSALGKGTEIFAYVPLGSNAPSRPRTMQLAEETND
jgi:two-component system sensor histidine kinase UhpB